MSIRNRIDGFDGVNTAAAGTTIIYVTRIPDRPGNPALVRGVRAYTNTMTATSLTVGFYISATNTPDDSAANSTTLIHDAIITCPADSPQSGAISTGPVKIPKGVVVYAKIVQTGTGAANGISGQVELDF